MMKKTKILSLASLLLVLVCALTAFTFTACGGSKVKITLSRTEVTVAEGGTANIVATVKGSTEQLEWKIDNPEVAEISVIGGKVCNVNAKKVGNAKVTATIGKVSAECRVTVVEDNTEKVTITLEGVEVTEVEVAAGAEKTLVATASNGSAITWQSGNEHIVTVDNGKITGVNKGTTTVSAIVSASIKAVVNVTVTGDGPEYKDIESTGETGAIAKKGEWTYYKDTWVTVDEAYSLGNAVTITFSNNTSDSPAHFYSTQLFYSNPELSGGTRYKLTFDADTTMGGRITLNGNVIKLESGKHSYTTYYVESNVSFSAQLGVNGVGMEITEGTLTFSNVLWEEDTTTEKLNAPSFTYAADTGVITIEDTNVAGSVGSYTLYFYNESNEVAGNASVANGEKVDLSTIPNGEYTVKLVAVAANVHYTNSDPSTVTATISVHNDTTKIKNGEEHDAYVNPGAWYEWHDQGWNGSTVTLGDAYVEDEAIHFSFEISGTNAQGQAAHLYKHFGDLVPEKVYTLTMKVKSSIECTVTICGAETELKVGDNNVEVVFTHPKEGADWQGKTNGATIRIYFNDSGSFVLSDISISEAEQTKLEAPSFSIADKVITITDGNTAGVGGYELGFFQNEELKTTVKVTNGEEINLSSVAAGEYTVKLRAVAASALYLTSDWSATSSTITSENQDVPIIFGEEAGFDSGWRYYDTKAAADWNGWTKTECTECKLDADGNVTMSYTCEGTGAAWAMQMFYKDGTNAAGYNVSFTITSTVATTITACGQQITLEANVAKTVTATNYTSATGNHSAIDIQFGFNGGTFVLSDISVTAVA